MPVYEVGMYQAYSVWLFGDSVARVTRAPRPGREAGDGGAGAVRLRRQLPARRLRPARGASIGTA